MSLIKVKLNDSIKIFLQDIIFITKINRKTTVYLTEERIIIINETIDSLEKQLKNKEFYRSHRGYLINIQKIKEFISYHKGVYQIIMSGTDERPLLARAKKKILEQKLELYRKMQLFSYISSLGNIVGCKIVMGKCIIHVQKANITSYG